MTAKMEPHTVNGRFYGGWYYLPSGQVIYVAHRKMREIYRKRHAWCIDRYTLEECVNRGVNFVAVAVRRGKKPAMFFLTPTADFFGPMSFEHIGDTRQRGLPLDAFRKNPSKSAAFIHSAMKI